jgi:hypothetical protein
MFVKVSSAMILSACILKGENSSWVHVRTCKITADKHFKSLALDTIGVYNPRRG